MSSAMWTENDAIFVRAIWSLVIDGLLSDWLIDAYTYGIVYVGVLVETHIYHADLWMNWSCVNGYAWNRLIVY